MSTEIADSDYWVSGYYSPNYDPQPITQPICWGGLGKTHDVCWRGCAYCPHTKDSKGNSEFWWISRLDEQTGKPIECTTYGYKRIAKPKFCMPTCDKNNYSGHCPSQVCVCPSQYSDCKKENRGVLGGSDGDLELCGAGTHEQCCYGPTDEDACPRCLVKSSAPGATDKDYKICNASKVISKHGCHVPSGESMTVEGPKYRPSCGNYFNLSLTWLQY